METKPFKTGKPDTSKILLTCLKNKNKNRKKKQKKQTNTVGTYDDSGIFADYNYWQATCWT